MAGQRRGGKTDREFKTKKHGYPFKLKLAIVTEWSNPEERVNQISLGDGNDNNVPEAFDSDVEVIPPLTPRDDERADPMRGAHTATDAQTAPGVPETGAPMEALETAAEATVALEGPNLS